MLQDDKELVERSKRVLAQLEASRPIQVVMTDEQFKQKMAIEQANRLSNAKDAAEGLGFLFLVGAFAVFILCIAVLSPRPYYCYRRYWY
jgi:hypothetical protein